MHTQQKRPCLQAHWSRSSVLLFYLRQFLSVVLCCTSRATPTISWSDFVVDGVPGPSCLVAYTLIGIGRSWPHFGRHRPMPRSARNGQADFPTRSASAELGLNLGCRGDLLNNCWTNVWQCRRVPGSFGVNFRAAWLAVLMESGYMLAAVCRLWAKFGRSYRSKFVELGLLRRKVGRARAEFGRLRADLGDICRAHTTCVHICPGCDRLRLLSPPMAATPGPDSSGDFDRICRVIWANIGLPSESCFSRPSFPNAC